MNIANAYRKSLAFFSRSRQEDIIASIEHEFYQTITIYAKDLQSISELNLKLEKICRDIRHHTAHSYFEDDLLEYMFNLLIFITNYREDLKARPVENHEVVAKFQMAN